MPEELGSQTKHRGRLEAPFADYPALIAIHSAVGQRSVWATTLVVLAIQLESRLHRNPEQKRRLADEVVNAWWAWWRWRRATRDA